MFDLLNLHKLPITGMELCIKRRRQIVRLPVAREVPEYVVTRWWLFFVYVGSGLN